MFETEGDPKQNEYVNNVFYLENNGFFLLTGIMRSLCTCT